MINSGKGLEVVVAIAFVAVAIAVFIEVSDLPPGLIDPLGSAPVPRWTAIILFLLSLAVLAKAFFAPTDRAPDETDAIDEPVEERFGAGFGVALLTVVYVMVFASRTVGFSILTFAYVLALVVLLSKDRVRGLWAGAILGALVGFGCEYLFTQIFVVDLPTWW